MTFWQGTPAAPPAPARAAGATPSPSGASPGFLTFVDRCQAAVSRSALGEGPAAVLLVRQAIAELPRPIPKPALSLISSILQGVLAGLMKRGHWRGAATYELANALVLHADWSDTTPVGAQNLPTGPSSGGAISAALAPPGA
jgi:hypothetical protein